MFRNLSLTLASDLGFSKQKSDLHSDFTYNYLARVELRKKQEKPPVVPVVESGSIPELLKCVADPKAPLRVDDQQSTKPARLVSGTAMKNEILRSYQEKFGADCP